MLAERSLSCVPLHWRRWMGRSELHFEDKLVMDAMTTWLLTKVVPCAISTCTNLTSMPVARSGCGRKFWSMSMVHPNWQRQLVFFRWWKCNICSLLVFICILNFSLIASFAFDGVPQGSSNANHQTNHLQTTQSSTKQPHSNQNRNSLIGSTSDDDRRSRNQTKAFRVCDTN